MNVMAAGCLLLDVCNKAVLNKSDFMLCDMRGLLFYSVWQIEAKGDKQGRCTPHLVYDSPAIIFFCGDSDKFGFVSSPLEQHRRGRNLGESIKLALPFCISISFLVLYDSRCKNPCRKMQHREKKKFILMHTSTGFKVKGETVPSNTFRSFFLLLLSSGSIWIER